VTAVQGGSSLKLCAIGFVTALTNTKDMDAKKNNQKEDCRVDWVEQLLYIETRLCLYTALVRVSVCKATSFYNLKVTPPHP
jgi:hypothetical protein